jgi:hypothetical protein
VRKFGAFTFLLLVGIYQSYGLAQPEPDINSFAKISCGKLPWFGSGTSEAYLQLRYRCLETGGNKPAGLIATLKIDGANVVSVDTTVAKAYAGSGLAHFSVLSVHKEYNPDPQTPDFVVTYGAVNFFGGIYGDSLWANVVVTVNDTGTICVDTFRIPRSSNWPLEYTTELAYRFKPFWFGPYCCKVELYSPGDVNLDKNVNIVDVVAQVGYVFRQRKPESVQAADVNGDCEITLADIFYLANYVFKAGEKPKVGCIL